MNAIVPQSWSHPPGCQCGCGGGQWGDVMDCWKEIAQFKAFLMQVLSEMGPIPIQGVVDGSDAKPGFVGEFIQASGTVNFTAYPNVTTATLSLVVIPPGDWDLWAQLNASTYVGGASISLSPLPAGMSNSMYAINLNLTAGTAGTEAGFTLNSMPARGSFSVPTLLPFVITIYNNIAEYAQAGTASLQFEARRRR